MKGLIFTLTIYYVFIGILIFLVAFNTENISFQKEIGGTTIADRISYLFNSINSDLKRIYSNEFNFQVTCISDGDTQIIFQHSLPGKDPSAFNNDVRNYTTFVTMYVDNTSNSTASIPWNPTDIFFLIDPYNLTYDYTTGIGQRQTTLDPCPSSSGGLSNITGYEINITFDSNYSIKNPNNCGGWSPGPSRASQGNGCSVCAGSTLSQSQMNVSIAVYDTSGHSCISIVPDLCKCDKSSWGVSIQQNGGSTCGSFSFTQAPGGNSFPDPGTTLITYSKDSGNNCVASGTLNWDIHLNKTTSDVSVTNSWVNVNNTNFNISKGGPILVNQGCFAT